MLLSTFYGEKEFFDRLGEVWLEDEVLVVYMYSQGVLVKTQEITEHTVRYAEDCAENWTIGIIN